MGKEGRGERKEKKGLAGGGRRLLLIGGEGREEVGGLGEEDGRASKVGEKK